MARTLGVSMKINIGDLVIYQEHIGVVLDRDITSETHLRVWFVGTNWFGLVYEPLLRRAPIQDLKELQKIGQKMSYPDTTQ